MLLQSEGERAAEASVQYVLGLLRYTGKYGVPVQARVTSLPSPDPIQTPRTFVFYQFR